MREKENKKERGGEKARVDRKRIRVWKQVLQKNNFT